MLMNDMGVLPRGSKYVSCGCVSWSLFSLNEYCKFCIRVKIFYFCMYMKHYELYHYHDLHHDKAICHLNLYSQVLIHVSKELQAIPAGLPDMAFLGAEIK